jgi:serine/threonine protein phosphatase PrpC/CRP-like cAMP-binding protein
MNFGEQSTDGFMGIYDGHGRDGDRCAIFAKNSLPQTVEKFVARAKTKEAKLFSAKNNKTYSSNEASIELTKDQIQTACLKAHIECNRAMHRAQELDDSLSGTTAISMYIHGRRNRITICNVGDSRAIIGQRVAPNESGTLVKASPLSRDQTPYRRDERARIRATGARILSLDQIEGLEPITEDDGDDDGQGDLELGEELDEGGDPPRVWSPHGEYPGTAFTRSLGDAIAEELGVFAEPEMLTREVTKDDQIIVLASDGVFEFLTNQSVIDICAKFSDPLEACRAVVAEAYELWLQYELRTDDITIVCLFIDQVNDAKVFNNSYISSSSRMLEVSSEFRPSPAATQEDSPGDDTVDAMVPTEGLRPVRAHLSKEKSKMIQQMKIKMASDTDVELSAMEEFDLSKLYTKKTAEEKSRIAEAIRASVMFQNITDEQREMIFGVMEPIKVKKGTWVIKQGTVGDRFYIVDTGCFEVRIVPDGEDDKDGSGGNVVHVYEGSHEKHAHPSFGELALMYSAPRAASIISQTDGHLWALHRYAFRQVLAQQGSRTELISTLKKMDLYKNLPSDDIKSIAAAMENVTFGRGECIIEQGQPGGAMFVISTGTCGMFDLVNRVRCVFLVLPLIEDFKTFFAEYVERLEGHRPHNATLKSGDFFGDEVMMDQKHYGATVVSLQTTSCWRIDRTLLKQTVGSLKPKKRQNIA